MKISVLVPCFNEEPTVEASVRAVLAQTRPADQILYVDDGSTDGTQEILRSFSNEITLCAIPENTGSKSAAQEYGLTFVEGDILITTDADTVLALTFIEEIEKSFSDPSTVAVAGHVSSVPHNWVTLARAFEYALGQHLHKRAQDHLRYIFVMPGAASAFRMSEFKKYVTFDHDTITEDLDFTYKLHLHGCTIRYNNNAVCYTQDPATVMGYLKQMRRWFGGGWQNLLKHRHMLLSSPARALELSLAYAEGTVFSLLLLVLPVLNPILWLKSIVGYMVVVFLFAAWAALREKRLALLLVPCYYPLFAYISVYVFLEQFVHEVVLRRNNMHWYKPARFKLS